MTDDHCRTSGWRLNHDNAFRTLSGSGGDERRVHELTVPPVSTQITETKTATSKVEKSGDAGIAHSPSEVITVAQKTNSAVPALNHTRPAGEIILTASGWRVCE